METSGKVALLLVFGLAAPLASAQDKKPDADSPANMGPQDTGALPDVADENVDINSIKEKYWARGDQSELGVVQNRIYSKNKKFQLGLLGSAVFADPFLSVKSLGLSLGYHFNDLFGVELMALNYFTGDSYAYTTFQEEKEGRLNLNPQKWFVGVSALGSFLYGKLSFFGKKIIYYDLYATAGAGLTNTQNGTYLTGTAGIGQRFYINQKLSLRFEYKLSLYNETLIESIVTNSLGRDLGSRIAFNHHIMLGADFLFDFSRKSNAEEPAKPETPEAPKIEVKGKNKDKKK